ncbi:MAG: zinc-ribbon domain containing protein [Planctomycetota bacterium]|nr:zinc-ribbon domain containing protein [Planctomycetota bacterium]MDA1212331.1 zinc-ribbon domain containing protein [Planctomycetota bacterium]
MKASVRKRLENVVPHPRYGKWIRTSDSKVDVDAINRTRRFERGEVFMETAIPADVTRQKPSVFQRVVYFDVLKICRTCGRDFIFYAEEQRFWYEELMFYLWSSAVDCCECRQDAQQLRKRNERFTQFSNAMASELLDDDSLVQFVEDAIFFWQERILIKRQKLNRIKNLSHRRLPDHPVTLKIEQFTRVLDQHCNAKNA